MNAAEEALARRGVTMESGSDLVKLVANLDLFFAMSLQIFEDGRVDHVGTVVTCHADQCTWGDDSCRV